MQRTHPKLGARPGLLALGLCLCLAAAQSAEARPTGEAQYLLVGGPDSWIRRAQPVSPEFEVVGASGGSVVSMAALGTTTYIGDRSGIVYMHTPATGVNYAFDSGTDARALGLAGSKVFVGGTSGALERYDAPSGTLESVWRAPGAIRALVVSGTDLVAGLASGEVVRAPLLGTGTFTVVADCGCDIAAMALDGGDLIVADTGGTIRRISATTQQVTTTFRVAPSCTALGLHLGQLLVATADRRIVRADRFDGTLHDVLAMGSDITAIAVTEGVLPAMTYCYGHGCPCGNDDGLAGCANSRGRGAKLAAAGSTSASADDFVLLVTHAPANAPAILVMGSHVGWTTLGDGLLCIGDHGLTRRFGASGANGLGTLIFTDLVAYAGAHFGLGAQLGPGTSWRFQVWYRDSNGPCGSGFNTTNSAEVTFTP